MKASRWVLGLVLFGVALTGCSTSSPSPNTATETVPIPADTFAPTTTTAAITTPPSPSVPPSIVAPSSEEALRARVEEFYAALNRSMLEPDSDFSTVKPFYMTEKDAQSTLAPLVGLNRSGGSTSRNIPDIAKLAIVSVERVDHENAIVTVCETDNYVVTSGGADQQRGTSDDSVISQETGTQKISERWKLVDGDWRVGTIVDISEYTGDVPCSVN